MAITTKQFIEKAREIHGDRYDYSKVVYLNSKVKVDIICEIHGIFEQTPNKHTSAKQGCRYCSGKYKRDNVTIVEEFKVIHGDKYDYSKVDYIDSETNVIIICEKHGEFNQIPRNHIHLKQGCPNCGKNIPTTDEFINSGKLVHGDKYDYSLVEYKNTHTKVKIICKKHGLFEQRPYAHIDKKQGCPDCNTPKGERKIKKHLVDNNISFESQKTFDGCEYKYKLRFDFYLPEHNTCIEFDGEQHYNENHYFNTKHSFEEQQIKDNIKTNYCKENNINLIRIRYDDDISAKLSCLFK